MDKKMSKLIDIVADKKKVVVERSLKLRSFKLSNVRKL
jgi:hypothetical protein